jgi:hypothetical protein
MLISDTMSTNFCLTYSIVIWSIHLPTKLHTACSNDSLIIIYTSNLKVNILIAAVLSFSIFKNIDIRNYVRTKVYYPYVTS